MGYYSEVAIAIEKKDFRKMIKEAIKASKQEEYKYVPALLIDGFDEGKGYCAYRATYEENIQRLNDISKILYRKSGVIVLKWNFVKWYYHDSEWIMKFIRTLDYYEYVRVGEGSGDMEQEHETDGDWHIEGLCFIDYKG